jgi:hypothetical protein
MPTWDNIPLPLATLRATSDAAEKPVKGEKERIQKEI